MTTLGEIISRLLPNGSSPDANDTNSCPVWPSDAFAVAATIVERSDCYALPRYTNSWEGEGFYFTENFRETVYEIGLEWIKTSAPPKPVIELWNTLNAHSSSQINKQDEVWTDAAVKILAIADEASKGMGFSDAKSLENPFARLLLQSHLSLMKREEVVYRHIPQSICIMVPPAEACVQPKTNTPIFGVTLRSMTHHLALLPPNGIVQTSWLFTSPDMPPANQPMNILLIPFPYSVHARSFKTTHSKHHKRIGFFSVEHAKLPRAAGDFANFLIEAVRISQEEVAQVHAIILPEAALPLPYAKKVAGILARRLPHLELFISGTLSEAKAPNPLNSAFVSFFYDGKILQQYAQSKHHRWGLNESQIDRYHLGAVLDPEISWWEQIQVRDRVCVFAEMREGASLGVLVCEDLARADPAIPVVSAVGPTLLVAILMDGPQLESRWSGRYATVLADDPGSSVLTLTCLGMVKRSTMPGEAEPRQIALWKEPQGATKELRLPFDALGLLLTISPVPSTQSTLDGREDGQTTQRFHLSGVQPISKSRYKTIPPWLEQ